MIFEPMNRYGDLREKRCKEIEGELSGLVAGLNMKHFKEYSKRRGKFYRVRWGTRIFILMIVVTVLLLGYTFWEDSLLEFCKGLS